MHTQLAPDTDRLKDLVARTEKNKLVTDLVNLDRVQSLLKTISHRRRFLAYREQMRIQQFEQQGKQSTTPLLAFTQLTPRYFFLLQKFHPSWSMPCQRRLPGSNWRYHRHQAARRFQSGISAHRISLWSSILLRDRAYREAVDA